MLQSYIALLFSYYISLSLYAAYYYYYYFLSTFSDFSERHVEVYNYNYRFAHFSFQATNFHLMNFKTLLLGTYTLIIIVPSWKIDPIIIM